MLLRLRVLGVGLLMVFAMFASFTIRAAEAACPAGSVVGSKNSASGGCVCPSGSKGTAATGTCTPYDVSSACPGGQLPTTSPMVTSTLGMNLITINMTGTDTLVRFSVSMPMMSGRNYTGVGVTGPAFTDYQADCTADKLFTNWTTISPTSGCVENWNITVDFTQLRKCGFVISSANDLRTGYQSFDGNIRVKFNEPLSFGIGPLVKNVTRQVFVDYPVRIRFDSNYVVPMTVNDVTVYAKHQVDIAITGQNIPKDPNATNPATATITYTVQYPYAIVEWGNCQTNDPIECSLTPMTTAKTCKAELDYSASDNANNSTCRKSDNTITFISWNGNNSTAYCKFSGYKYVVPFTVWCAEGVLPEDCPLAVPDTSGTVTFTITTENFCTQLAETDNINGAIRITAFKAVFLSDYTTQQNAWRYNDDIFMRMDFSGLPLQTCHMTRLERFYSNNPITPGNETWVKVGQDGVVNANSGAQTTSIILAGFTDQGTISTTNLYVTLAQGNFGLQSNGAEYRFKLKANTDLLGSNSEPTRGADSFLRLRATIDVTYDTPLTNGRRRRRQAGADSGAGGGGSVSGGKGVKVSETQQISPSEPVQQTTVDSTSSATRLGASSSTTATGMFSLAVAVVVATLAL